MFILTTERVVTDYPYSDGTVLSFRRFEGDERDQFDKARAKLVGRKNFGQNFEKLLRQTAELLLVRWKVAGPDRQVLELTPENKAAFFAHPDAKAYWWGPIYQYLYPSREDGDDGGELPEAEDADFFTTR